MTTTNAMPLVDLASHRDTVLEDVIEGLSGAPKRLSSKYFYDRRGSELFDAICELPEYYPTRTELAIMRQHLQEISAVIGANACIVEIGSGSGMKTDMLLQALDQPNAYVPIDISRDHLMQSAHHLARRYPQIEVYPVCADFLQPFSLPADLPAYENCVVYFPGSTLGNLTTRQADRLLAEFADLVREVNDGVARGGLLLGVDLQKDPCVLEAAYNDKQGVTAEFNLNILHHINRRLGCEIPADSFKHSAPYCQEQHRIEMYLVAQQAVEFSVGSREFTVQRGEAILTKYSHKYDLPELFKRLKTTGWSVRASWTDPKQYFGLLYCDLA
jgi:dimethylhistidine N-methyltransferase